MSLIGYFLGKLNLRSAVQWECCDVSIHPLFMFIYALKCAIEVFDNNEAGQSDHSRA